MAKRSSNKYLQFYYNEVLPFVNRNGIQYNNDLWDRVKENALEQGRITQEEYDEWTPPFNVHFFRLDDIKRAFWLDNETYMIPKPVWKYINNLERSLKRLGRSKFDSKMIDEETYKKALEILGRKKRGRKLYVKDTPL